MKIKPNGRIDLPSPYPSVVIGKYKIVQSQPKIMIRHESGEAGEFDTPKFEAAIAKFFSENF